jgi:hypothetical protein
VYQSIRRLKIGFGMAVSRCLSLHYCLHLPPASCRQYRHHQ